MKFSRFFFLKNLKKNFSRINFFLFFKFQPMTAQQWFSLRMNFKEKGASLVVLKKRELNKFLLCEKGNFSVDADNTCLTTLDNLNFFIKYLNNADNLNTTNLRFFLLRLGSQILTVDYLKNFLTQKELHSKDLFNNNVMFLQKNFVFLKFNISSALFLSLIFRNLILKE